MEHETADGRIKLMFKKAAVMTFRKSMTGGGYHGEGRCASCGEDVVFPVRFVFSPDRQNAHLTTAAAAESIPAEQG
jgi:hypothetical protein